MHDIGMIRVLRSCLVIYGEAHNGDDEGLTFRARVPAEERLLSKAGGKAGQSRDSIVIL